MPTASCASVDLINCSRWTRIAHGAAKLNIDAPLTSMHA